MKAESCFSTKTKITIKCNNCVSLGALNDKRSGSLASCHPASLAAPHPPHPAHPPQALPLSFRSTVSCLSNASLNCPYTSGHSTARTTLPMSLNSLRYRYASSGRSVSSFFSLCVFAFINCCLYLASFYLICFSFCRPPRTASPLSRSPSLCFSLSLSRSVRVFGLLFWSPLAAIKPNLIDLSLPGLLISRPLYLGRGPWARLQLQLQPRLLHLRLCSGL